MDPLVSICVVTYNSAEYVTETLNSILQQSYPNIEVIISDDNSKDNTIDICNEWIEKNKTSFKNVSLVRSESNTGVAGNLNRAIKTSKGIWIKGIAGDDILYPDCILKFVNFIKNNPRCKVVEGKVTCFGEDELLVYNMQNFQEGLGRYYNKDRRQMYKDALTTVILAGPALFYKRDIWELVGGFDEKYPCSEEFPFQVKVLSNNDVYYMNDYVVKYRINPKSLSRNRRSRCADDTYKYFIEERGKLMLKEKLYMAWFDEYIRYIVYINQLPYLCSKLLLNFSPLLWKKRLLKLLRNNF